MRLRSLAAAAAALLAARATPALAQTFPTDDPVLKRIWALGMDSSHTEQLAHVLFDSIGPRLTGTPLHKAANDWLVSTYKSWGVSARNEKVGTWRGWRRGWSHIDLMTPRVRSLEGTMLGYSPGTNGKAVTLGTIILPHFADSSEFVKWLPQARGKLVLASAPMPSCRSTDEIAQFATPATKARLDSARAAVRAEWAGRNVRGTGYSMALGGGELGLRLEQGGAGGLITSRPKDALGTVEIFETYNTKTPAIALSCEDYGLVFRLTEQGDKPQLRLDLDAQLLGEQPIFNTVAEVKGSEKPDEYVLLSAHFDSWDGSSGATDNGTGTLTMLEAMRILREAYPKPKRTILVGHWTGEEEGEVGSKAFTEDHPEVVSGLQALFNQDNGTGRVVRTSGGGLPDGAEHMSAWLAKVPGELTSYLNFGGAGFPAGGGSDDFSFACSGAPAFGLGALSWNYNSVTWHTNRDTYDKVVFDDLKANATLTAMLAYLASEDPSKVTRERVDLAAEAARQQQLQQQLQQQRPAQQPNATANAGAGRGGRGFGGGARTWPVCVKAPRSTEPRLK
jgi:hypothetical protein